MTEFIRDLKRSHRCGSLRPSDNGQTVVLMGWVDTRRDHGGCVFIDLRDREGITQVVFEPHTSAEAHSLAGELRTEWVFAVLGVVRSRGDKANAKLATGAIEVAAKRLHIFAKAETPPFLLSDSNDTAEEVRLTYRYLDLRRERMQSNLQKRHRFNQVVRRVLDQEGFLELETPFLMKSTPEGARDFIVPARLQPGKFFALPQSPQLLKQLLMVAGYDRYFQITRCFRDEDLRADRQPEFTQVDFEMSFCAPQDVQDVTEKILAQVWQEIMDQALVTPFERITYAQVMARFGVDAPDLRFGLELKDISEAVRGSGFKVFSEALAAGGNVNAVNLTGIGDFSRSELDALIEYVKIFGAKGMAWVKVKEDGEWQSPIAKFFTDSERREVGRILNLKPADIAVFVADQKEIVWAALGNLRRHLAKERKLVKSSDYRFCWVTDFPLFHFDAKEKRYVSAHHPFTAPHPDDVAAMEQDLGKVRAQAYDIVLNGTEIGGGSIRINNTELQERVFRCINIDKAEAQQKFGFLLQALSYGAPPHGGLALGADRIMMMLCQTDSIREVIAFPKTQKGTDLMLGAPDDVSLKQLAELSIRTVLPTKS